MCSHPRDLSIPFTSAFISALAFLVTNMSLYGKSGQASSFADSKSRDEEKLQPDQDAISVQDSFSWTPEEEKKARRKYVNMALSDLPDAQ